MFGIGMPEMLLILAIALIVIGPKKLPDLAKSLGKALGEFKKATSDLKESMQIDTELKDLKSSFDSLGKEDKPAGKAASGGVDEQPIGAAAPVRDGDERSRPDRQDEPEAHLKSRFERSAAGDDGNGDAVNAAEGGDDDTGTAGRPAEAQTSDAPKDL